MSQTALYLSLLTLSSVVLFDNGGVSAFSMQGGLHSIIYPLHHEMNEEEHYIKSLDRRYHRLHDGFTSAQDTGSSMKSANIIGEVFTKLSTTSVEPYSEHLAQPLALRVSIWLDHVYAHLNTAASKSFVRGVAVVWIVSILRIATSLLSQFLSLKKVHLIKYLSSLTAIGTQSLLQYFS